MNKNSMQRFEIGDCTSEHNLDVSIPNNDNDASDSETSYSRVRQAAVNRLEEYYSALPRVTKRAVARQSAKKAAKRVPSRRRDHSRRRLSNNVGGVWYGETGRIRQSFREKLEAFKAMEKQNDFLVNEAKRKELHNSVSRASRSIQMKQQSMKQSPSYHVVLSDDSDVNLSLKPNLRREVARPRMGRRSLGHCDLKREFSPKERQRGLSRRLTEKEKDANGLEGRGPEGRRLSIQQRNSAVLQLRERKHELEAKREAKNVSDTEKKYDAQFRGHGAEADKDSSRACRKLTAERRVSEGESVRSTQGSSDSCGLHAHACPQLPPRGAWNGQAYTVAVACGQPYLPPGTNPSAGSAYCESYFGHACMHTHAPTPLISTHTLPCGVMPSLQSPLFLAVDAPQNTREYSRSSGGMEPSQRTCEQTLHPCKISKNVSVATSSSSEPLSSMKSSPRHTVAVNADDTNVGVLGVNTLTLDEEVSTQVLIAQSREPRSEEKSPYSGCGDFEKTDPKPVAAAPSDAPAVISAETLLNDKAAPMVAPPSVPGTQNSENLPQNNTTLSPKTECDEGTIRSPGVPRTDLCASSQSQKDQFVTGSEHSNAKNLSSGTQCEMELHDETTEFLTEVDCRLEGLLRCLHSAETLREYFALKHPSNALLQNDISDTDRLRDSDADGEKTKKGSFSPSPFGSLAHTLLGISHILGRPALHKNIDPDLLLPSVQQGVADVPEVGLYSMLLRARNSDHAGAPFAPSRYNYPGNQDARSLCTSLTRNEATPMGIGDDGADSAYVHTMADSPLTHASPASAPSESVRMAQKLHIASVEGSTHKGAEKQLFQDTAEQRALLVQSASRLVMPALSPVPVTREQRWQSRYGELAADQGTHKQSTHVDELLEFLEDQGDLVVQTFNLIAAMKSELQCLQTQIRNFNANDL